MNTEFGAHKLIEFSNGVFITETVVNTWIIMILLAVGSYILTRKMKLIPDGKQSAAEILVGLMTS